MAEINNELPPHLVPIEELPLIKSAINRFKEQARQELIEKIKEAYKNSVDYRNDGLIQWYSDIETMFERVENIIDSVLGPKKEGDEE